jgi:hypothetical protein
MVTSVASTQYVPLAPGTATSAGPRPVAGQVGPPELLLALALVLLALVLLAVLLALVLLAVLELLAASELDALAELLLVTALDPPALLLACEVDPLVLADELEPAPPLPAALEEGESRPLVTRPHAPATIPTGTNQSALDFLI